MNTKEKKADAAKISGLQVSKQTADIVACMEDADALFGKYSAVITSIYGDAQGDEIMGKFYEKYAPMYHAMQEACIQSICENISHTKSTNLI